MSDDAPHDMDLFWICVRINHYLARKWWAPAGNLFGIAAVEPQDGWEKVLKVLKRLRITIAAPNNFNESAYLMRNPDVAEAIKKGTVRSGYMHYVQFGRFERRPRQEEQSKENTVQSKFGQIKSKAAHIVSSNAPAFNPMVQMRRAQARAGFDKVLHVAHHEWHGIRQATAYNPGNKLLISAHCAPSAEEKAAIAAQISQRGIDRIVFQGYSNNADQLLLYFSSQFGPDLQCYCVTHVNTAQFENSFEMTMQERLLNRRRTGQLKGLGSVKANFSEVFDEYWPHLILNFAPHLPQNGFHRRQNGQSSVYAPLDPGWRKNMFTNILAANMAINVDVIKTANYPDGLENLIGLGKLRLIGYLRGDELLQEMADSSLVLLATLAECQPMTQLEALAVGTPALTGPLYLMDFVNDPLIQLCVTDKLDNPALLRRDIERIIDAQISDPDGMTGMISEHLARRHDLAAQRYAEFLEL